MKRLIFLTGRPGVGKTTVLLRVVGTLKALGYVPGGMISREFRENGVRVGFEVIDVQTGVKGWLAHVNQPSGPRVGKYRVNIQDLERIGAKSIVEAVKKADFIVIDEIGPMELHSPAFVNAVFKAVESGKPVTGTMHWRARGHLIDVLRKNVEAEIVEVSEQNRERLHKIIVDKCLKVLKT